jgi:hypothetical protein
MSQIVRKIENFSRAYSTWDNIVVFGVPAYYLPTFNLLKSSPKMGQLTSGEVLFRIAPMSQNVWKMSVVSGRIFTLCVGFVARRSNLPICSEN